MDHVFGKAAVKRTLALILILGCATWLWAAPATVENLHFKATLSETLPGLDDQSPLAPNAGITITIQDKTHNNAFQFPLQAYSVPVYFLVRDTLNVLARTTVMGARPVPFYDFLQLDLANPSQSRRYSGLRQFSVSPDQQSLLMVLDKGNAAPWLALAHLEEGPAQVSWIYAEDPPVNLFQKAFSGPVSGLVVNEPIAWSGDSLTGALLLSVDLGAKDGLGKVLWSDYLARMEWTSKGWKVTTQALDLSQKGFHTGSALTDLKVLNDHVALFLAQDEDTTPVEIDVKTIP